MMDTVTVSNSVFVNGQWATAHWHAEFVDETTGDLVITAVRAGEGGGPVVWALRMTSDLMRELRAMAGFGVDGPSTNAVDTDARMAERMDELERRQFLDHRTMHATFNEHQARLDGWEGALNERVTQLEKRMAVLEEDQ